MSAQTNTPTGWVGWSYFAGFMMMLLGVLQGISGLTAIFNDEFYVATQSKLLVLDFTAWGWVHLVIGIVIFMAGAEVMRGATWARTIGVFLAGLSLIANMGFLNAYPFWSILMITIDVLIIYALIVHGGELRE
jgi:hypothetical protein